MYDVRHLNVLTGAVMYWPSCLYLYVMYWSSHLYELTWMYLYGLYLVYCRQFCYTYCLMLCTNRHGYVYCKLCTAVMCLYWPTWLCTYSHVYVLTNIVCIYQNFYLLACRCLYRLACLMFMHWSSCLFTDQNVMYRNVRYRNVNKKNRIIVIYLLVSIKKWPIKECEVGLKKLKDRGHNSVTKFGFNVFSYYASCQPSFFLNSWFPKTGWVHEEWPYVQ